MTYKYKCAHCGEENETFHDKARYCSERDCQRARQREDSRRKRARELAAPVPEGHQKCARCRKILPIEVYPIIRGGKIGKSCPKCHASSKRYGKKQGYPLKSWTKGGRRKDLTDMELEMIRDEEYGGDSTCFSCKHLHQCRARVRRSMEESKLYLTQCMF